jgi:hypothetical protein
MKEFVLMIGGWITTVMIVGMVLKLNWYIFMWGWNLV